MTPHFPLATLRAKAPLAQSITNYVASNIAANVSLAADALPAMIHAPEKVTDFVPIAGAFSINIGTVQAQSFAGCDETKSKEPKCAIKKDQRYRR